MNENIEKKQSWLERNPKKTLLIIIIVPILLIMFLTEKYLGYRNAEHGIKSGIQREIRLREHPPLSMLTKIPYDVDMKESEGLVQKEYSFRVDENGFKRVSGTSLGGGTFLGLCKLITNMDSFEEISRLSSIGDNKKLDLLVFS